MTFWVLTQVLVNLVLVAGVAFLWFRLNRPAKDDPRLSRGLQLLQSKISIIEDLSDRTDTQFQQLTMLMEQKIKDIQDQMQAADKHVRHIETSTARSLEVAKIFQDKIPHQEIIERQNTIKYVKAARLAFRGMKVEEIAKEVDLPRGELEFIAKVNRTQLQFSESDLPEWIEDEETTAGTTASFADHEPTLSIPTSPTSSLSELGDKFRQALTTAPAAAFEMEQSVTLRQTELTITPLVPQQIVPQQTIPQQTIPQQTIPQQIVEKPAPRMSAAERANPPRPVRTQSKTPTTVVQPKDDTVRKVVFPRVDMAKNLG